MILRLWLGLLTLLFIHKPTPKPAAAISSRPSQPMAYTPDPEGPVIPDWHYHSWMTAMVTDRPDMAEIAQLHLEQCWEIQPVPFTPPAT